MIILIAGILIAAVAFNTAAAQANEEPVQKEKLYKQELKAGKKHPEKMKVKTRLAEEKAYHKQKVKSELKVQKRVHKNEKVKPGSKY